jgi:hypothetical protein
MSPISDECNTKVIDQINSGKNDENINIDMKIDKAAYKECVRAQKRKVFDGQGDNVISYLDRDKEAQKKVGSVFHPSISVNEHSFRGEYENPNDLFKAICSVMKDKPPVCR